MKITSYPQRIVIELTTACNLACPMCPRRYINDKDGYMPFSLWDKLVNEIRSQSPESIILPFWRGESLLHPEFIGFLDAALMKDLRIHLSTNGTFLEDHHARILLRSEFITFSVHNALGFKRAQEFLLLRHGNKPVTQISFVRNEPGMQEFYDSVISSGNLSGFDSLRIYEEHSLGGVFGKSEVNIDTERHFCPRLENTLVIAYDGSVSRCSHIWNTERRLNALEMTIREIWDSAILHNVRQAYPDSCCAACSQWGGHTRGEVYRSRDGKIEHRFFSPNSANMSEVS